MTEENKTGVVAGSESQVDSKAGNEKVTDSKPTVEELMSQLEQEKKAGASKDKAYAEAMAKLKTQEEEAEKERVARLTDSERLKELEATIEADKQEKSLINAATSKGLNPLEAKAIVDKIKAGDFDGFADKMSELLNKTQNEASQKAEEEFKSKFNPVKTPNINDSTKSDAFMDGLKKGAGL